MEFGASYPKWIVVAKVHFTTSVVSCSRFLLIEFSILPIDPLRT